MTVSSLLDIFEVIYMYQTQENVFHRDNQTLRFENMMHSDECLTTFNVFG